MTGRDIPTLYHFTCGHGREGIGETGTLIPLATRSPRAARELDRQGWPELAWLIWATDLAVPSKGGLGLTSQRLHCDRTQYRYRVTDDRDLFRRWRQVRAEMPGLAHYLELGRARPWRWWVAAAPVAVVLDPLPAPLPPVVVPR